MFTHVPHPTRPPPAAAPSPGILSSFGELAHMASGGAALEPFNPFAKQPKMSYKDGFQTRYFVLQSFDEGARQLRDYAATARLPESLRGDASVA